MKKLETEKDAQIQQTLANRYLKEVFPYYQNERESASQMPRLDWDFKGAENTMRESDRLVETNGYERALSKIECPIAVIHGTEDPLSPGSLFPLFEKHQPTATLHEIAGAGHYLWIGPKKNEFLKILSRELI